MTRAVLFDLDGTLLDRASSVVRFAREQHSRFEPLQHMTPEDYIRSFVELDDNGHVWKDSVYKQLIARHALEGIVWQTLLDDYVNNFANSCLGFAGLHAVLATLQDDGYQLGMITNGRSPFQEKNIEALGIQDFFSTILVSEAVGMRKPEAAIFTAALSGLGVLANEAVFVGDSPVSDIAGAQKTGMKTVWKSSEYWKTCEYANAICHELMELPDIIRRL